MLLDPGRDSGGGGAMTTAPWPELELFIDAAAKTICDLPAVDHSDLAWVLLSAKARGVWVCGFQTALMS